MSQRPSVVVTGLGALSSLGPGVDALWAAIGQGRDGIQPIARFSTEGFSVRLAGMVPGYDTAPPCSADAESSLCTQFARLAAVEAWGHAGCPDSARTRTALILGTSTADRLEHPHALVATLGDALGFCGPRLVISTACSSSTGAIGLGCDLLRWGAADIVLAGGVDVLTPDIFAGFHALGLLSAEKCAPFSLPEGTTLGEGAGFLVLETAEHAKRRGATVRASVLGYGLSSDAYHPSTPDPTGAGVARALQSALHNAGLPPEAVDYVNAHGTGTSTNDPAEWRAIRRVFGDRAASQPVISLKGHLAHAQGAAGVLEIIGSLLGLREQLIPPTLHFSKGRLQGPGDVVGEGLPRPRAHRIVACNNSAFGGHNAALIVGLDSGSGLESGLESSSPACVSVPAPGSVLGSVSASVQAPAATGVPVPAASESAGDRPVYVIGAGAVGEHGLDLSGLLQTTAIRAPGRRRVPPFRLEALVPSADPRGLDPSALYLLAAAALALRDGGVTLRGALRERTGILAGVTRLSPDSVGGFNRSIAERGLPRLAANLLPHMVYNAPVGYCSQRLGLRGPSTALCAGTGSGLLSILYGARWLATRDDADLLLVGGVDERADSDDEALGEGAACLLLSPTPGPLPIAVSGVALAGPGSGPGSGPGPRALVDCAKAALCQAGLDGLPVDAVYASGATDAMAALQSALAARHGGAGPRFCRLDARFGVAPSAAAALGCALAVAELRAGSVQSALVVAAGEGTVSQALVLKRLAAPTPTTQEPT